MQSRAPYREVQEEAETTIVHHFTTKLRRQMEAGELQAPFHAVREKALPRFVDYNLSAPSRTSLQLRGCQ